MEAAALIHSSSLTRFPSPVKTTLRIARLNSFILLQPKTIPIHTPASLRLPRRSFHLLTKATGENHHHEHDHHHHHHHHHRHCCAVGSTVTNHPQEVLINFAKAIGWTRLANFLREHLHLCCSSAVLFLAAAACPHLIPKPYIKPYIAFPLVGVMLHEGGTLLVCLNSIRGLNDPSWSWKPDNIAHVISYFNSRRSISRNNC